MSGNAKGYDETKQKSFLIKDENMLKKYYKIWYKVSNSIKKGFDICNVQCTMKNI